MKTIVTIILSSLVLMTGQASAEDDPITFINKVEYNLYYTISDDQTGLIERVEVIGVHSFYGHEFLVFSNESPGFDNKRTRGFVRFDAVKSMVPSDYDTFKNTVKK